MIITVIVPLYHLSSFLSRASGVGCCLLALPGEWPTW